MSKNVLNVVTETEILGKTIKLYGSIDNPWFMASDVADWIEHSNARMMLKKIEDDEKGVNNVYTLGGVQEKWFLTEDGLYEVCMQSRKPIAKEMKKEIKKYLKSIRLTGAAIPVGDEQKMISYYFSGLSSDLQGQIVNELIEKNRELQGFYNALINTEGLLSMNTVAKELGVGLKRLYLFLRNNDVMFYKGNVNIPYQRFMEQGLFEVKETPCHDGNYRPVTYATRKGLDYIRKLLAKKNQFCAE